MATPTDTFHEVRNEILITIDTIAEQDPGLASYLYEHIVFDEERGTVAYTGDPWVVEGAAPQLAG